MSDPAPAEQTLRLVQLSSTPRIYQADNFASPAELEQILAIALNSQTLAARGLHPSQSGAGLAFEWPIAREPLLVGLTQRLHALVGFDNDLGETLRFRRYLPGESHPAHQDVFQVGRKWLILTALLYLTDTLEGGETHFPLTQPTPVSIAPRAGRLALWFNHLPNGEPDPAALHAALAVTRGEKATLGSFIYKPLSFAALEFVE